MVPAACCVTRAVHFLIIERISADANYQEPIMAKVVADTGPWAIQVVEHSDLHKFAVPPKRWIIERTFAWISRTLPLGARLRTLRQHRRRIYLSRHDPHHAQTPDQAMHLPLNPIFLDRL